MELKVVRDRFERKRTYGKLYIDGVYFCETLEDRVREVVPGGPFVKVPKETAIPVGRYRVLITLSTRFKVWLMELLKVPMFAGIRVHAGNTEENTEGCILVGFNRGMNGDALPLLNSKKALEKLQPLVATALAKGDEVWITVEGLPHE